MRSKLVDVLCLQDRLAEARDMQEVSCYQLCAWWTVDQLRVSCDCTAEGKMGDVANHGGPRCVHIARAAAVCTHTRRAGGGSCGGSRLRRPFFLSRNSLFGGPLFLI